MSDVLRRLQKAAKKTGFSAYFSDWPPHGRGYILIEYPNGTARKIGFSDDLGREIALRHATLLLEERSLLDITLQELKK